MGRTEAASRMRAAHWEITVGRWSREVVCKRVRRAASWTGDTRASKMEAKAAAMLETRDAGGIVDEGREASWRMSGAMEIVSAVF